MPAHFHRPPRLLPVTALAAMLALWLPAQAAPEPIALPIVRQPLTLSWYANLHPSAATSLHDLSEQTAYRELAERTGIRVAFQHPPIGGEKERFKLLVVSGKYPDVVEADWADYPGGPAKALKDGMIVPLNALIAHHAPNLSALLDANPDIRRQISTDDGTIYCFPMLYIDPRVRNVWGPQIRQDWLDKLGLRQPTTLAEWHAVLSAFKTRDPNGNGRADEIPYSTFTVPGVRNAPGLPPGLWPFLGAFGLAPEFYRSGGRIRYSPAEPAYKDFLATLHRWYREGLIDPDYVSQEQKPFDTKMSAGRIGAYAFFNGSGLGRYTLLARAGTPGFRLAGVPYPRAADGRRHITYPPAAQIFRNYGAAISRADRNVVETVKFLDYGYSAEGSLTLNFGKQGVSYTLVGGEPHYTDAVRRHPTLSVSDAILRHARPQYGPLVQDPRYLEQFYALPEQRQALAAWADGDTDLLLPPLQAGGRNARKFASLMSDIETYVAEMTTKFILGREPLDRFDDYRAKLDRAGMQEAIGYMQAAYDQYRRKPIQATLPGLPSGKPIPVATAAPTVPAAAGQ